MKAKPKVGIFYNTKDAGGIFLADIIKELSKLYDVTVFEINKVESI